jgi:hypothetical protein
MDPVKVEGVTENLLNHSI